MDDKESVIDQRGKDSVESVGREECGEGETGQRVEGKLQTMYDEKGGLFDMAVAFTLMIFSVVASSSRLGAMGLKSGVSTRSRSTPMQL